MPLSPFHSHVTGESLRRLFRELRMILLSGAAGDLAEDAEHHIRGMLHCLEVHIAAADIQQREQPGGSHS